MPFIVACVLFCLGVEQPCAALETVGRSNRKRHPTGREGGRRERGAVQLKLAAIFINPPSETGSEGIMFNLC